MKTEMKEAGKATSPRPSPHAPHAERERADSRPVFPGVEFIDWSETDGRAGAVILRQALPPEVQRQVYRRLPSEARLNLALTKRIGVVAVVCTDEWAASAAGLSLGGGR